MLVLSADNEPTLLVPILERPDAEAAEGAGSVSLVDWSTAPTPMRSPVRYCGRMVSSGSLIVHGPCICLVCSEHCHSRVIGR
jgi:hypothetical protein